RIIARLPLPPHVVNNSGHGIHGYWRSSTIPTKADMERVEKLTRRIAEILGADIKVCQGAALMRLPGTLNSKSEPHVRAQILGMREGTCTIEELEDWARNSPILIERKTKLSATRKTATPANPHEAYGQEHAYREPLDIDARLEAMTWKGPGETSVHATQVDVIASLLSRNVHPDEAVRYVLEWTQFMCDRDSIRGWNFNAEQDALRDSTNSWYAKHP